MAQQDFRLPDLGEGLEDAEVVRWLVAEGDVITLNQPLIEVDTAKALVEIPSPVSGTVSKLHAAAGDTVKVGATLVSFEVVGSKRTAVLVGYGAEEGTAASSRRRLSGVRGPGRTGRREGPAPLPTPPIRKLAAELGVDLTKIEGSGPDGKVTRDDVLMAKPVPITGVRKLIADKMTRSWNEIPHVTTFLTVNATQIMAQKTLLAVSPLAIVAKGLVEVCKSHPKLNSSLKDGGIVLKDSVHLGIATDTERGLLVPVVRYADKLETAALAREIKRLVTAARKSKSSPDDLRGSTITISNVGSFGAEYGTPIINHPEAAILALGVIEERPVVRNGVVVALPMVTLSLSFDHRILDGAEAGRALADLRVLLQMDG